jgi:hypothetical protein
MTGLDTETASRLISTATATSSSGCSAASKASAASPPDTTAEPRISSPTDTLPRPSGGRLGRFALKRALRIRQPCALFEQFLFELRHLGSVVLVEQCLYPAFNLGFQVGKGCITPLGIFAPLPSTRSQYSCAKSPMLMSAPNIRTY